MAGSPVLAAAARLRVLDLGRGLPAGVFAKFFADAGARVTRVEPPTGDPFREVYPAYPAWYDGVELVAADRLDELLASADVCFVGGEDHPDLAWSFDPDDLSARYPSLVVVSLTAREHTRPADVPAVELLVQAALGMTAEHFSDRHIYAALAPGLYGGALLALLGAWTALIDRLRDGRGQVVRTSLEQGMAIASSQLWMTPQEPNRAFDVYAPLDLQHLVFPCADGEYLQFTYGVPGAVRRVYDILGLETDADERDPGGPRIDRGARNYYGMYDELAGAVARFRRDDLLERLRAAGIPAEPVLAPGECWEMEQSAATGIIRSHVDGSRSVASALHHRPAPAPSANTGPAPAEPGDLPLRGLRVLDFGTLVAGPYASTLLGRLGAEVIKVESASARPSAATVRNMLAVNPGKRSLCLDVKADEGREVLARLCHRVDVVHHNFRVGVPARLGLDAESLWPIDPRVITVTTTAFGATGPKAFDSGIDMAVAAVTGHQRRAGGRDPMWYRAPAIDYFCGALGAIGILMSYYERSVTGYAPAVENSLYETGLFLLQDILQTPDGEIRDHAVLDEQRRGIGPTEQLYPTADGWLAVVARSRNQVTGLLTALGLSIGADDVATDPDGARQAIGDALGVLPTAVAAGRLTDHGVWAVPARERAWESLMDGAAIGKGSMVSTVMDATYGRVTGCFGDLVSLSRRPAVPPDGPGLRPRGADTRDLLGELGYSDAEVQDLYTRGVVA